MDAVCHCSFTSLKYWQYVSITQSIRTGGWFVPLCALKKATAENENQNMWIKMKLFFFFFFAPCRFLRNADLTFVFPCSHSKVNHWLPFFSEKHVLFCPR